MKATFGILFLLLFLLPSEVHKSPRNSSDLFIHKAKEPRSPAQFIGPFNLFLFINPVDALSELLKRSMDTGLDRDQRALMELTRRHAVFMSEGNGAFIRSILECNNYLARQERGEAVYEPNFIMRLRGVLGNEINHEYTCQEIYERYFGYQASEPYTFRRSFRSMQYHSILSQSGIVFSISSGLTVSDMFKELLKTETLDGSYQKKFPSYEHPIRVFTDLFWGQMSRMPRPAKVVFDKASETYNQSIRNNCNSFVREKRKGLAKKFNESPNSPYWRNLCRHLIYKNVQRGKQRLSRHDKAKLENIQQHYLVYAAKKRAIFQEEHRKLYMESLMEFPHYVFVPQLNLSLAQIAVIANKMRNNQHSSLQELKRLKGDALLSLFPIYQTFPMTVNSILSKRLGWSEAKIEQVADAIGKKYARKETLKSVGDMALIVGSFVLCTRIPAGRALGVATVGFKRGVCYLTIGNGIEIKFLADAAMVRSRVFRDFAQTAEAEYAMFNVEKMDEANKDLLMTMLFVPLAIQPKLTVNVYRNARRIIHEIRK